MHRKPFTDIRLSKSGKYLLAGTADGTVCIRKFRIKDILLQKWKHGHQTYEQYSKELEDEMAKIVIAEKLDHGADAVNKEILKKTANIPGQFWLGCVHDCIQGSITSVQTSFDDSYFVSSGADGGLFIWKILTETSKKNLGLLQADFDYLIHVVVEDELFESTEGKDVTADILDPASYSIQEVKIKSEHDREIEEAEKKKQVNVFFLRMLLMITGKSQLYSRT